MLAEKYIFFVAHMWWIVLVAIGIFIVLGTIALFLHGEIKRERAFLLFILGVLFIVLGVLAYFLYFVA